MVLTVEPGLYLKDKGLGVRIEDDVLITPDGVEVLSDTIPRDARAMEQWMAELQAAPD
jgi:Xaa-Pro aminopeptidase